MESKEPVLEDYLSWKQRFTWRVIRIGIAIFIFALLYYFYTY